MQMLSRRSRLRTISVSLRRNWGLLILLLPAVIFAAIFMYRPMVGILIAFKDYKPAKGILGSPWTSYHGFKYFRMFFDTYNCWTVIWNTIAVSLYTLVVSFPIPIIFALLLNQMQHARFKKIVQTVTYAPHFISMVVLVGIMRIMFAPSSGLVNLALSALGFKKVMFLTDAAWFRHLYVWSGVWQNTGWDSIIYIAALASVSPELHEAATVDGASKLQRILYVDFPSILPIAMYPVLSSLSIPVRRINPFLPGSPLQNRIIPIRCLSLTTICFHQRPCRQPMRTLPSLPIKACAGNGCAASGIPFWAKILTQEFCAPAPIITACCV